MKNIAMHVYTGQEQSVYFRILPFQPSLGRLPAGENTDDYCMIIRERDRKFVSARWTNDPAAEMTDREMEFAFEAAWINCRPIVLSKQKMACPNCSICREQYVLAAVVIKPENHLDMPDMGMKTCCTVCDAVNTMVFTGDQFLEMLQ